MFFCSVNRVYQLLYAGVPVDSFDTPQTKNSLLNWAAEFSTPEVIQALLTNSATIDLANAKGETALHTTVKRGHQEITKILLAHGANPNISTNAGLDAFGIAEKFNSSMLAVLSIDLVAKNVQNNERANNNNVDDVDDRASLISCTETLNTQIFADTNRYEKYMDGSIDSWTDLLWPQPKLVSITNSSKSFQFPKDGKLKIYFDDCSNADPRQIMQIIELSKTLLQSVGVDIEYRGHRTADHEISTVEGKVTCGIFEDGRTSGSYTLNIDSTRGIEVVGSDYVGIRYAFTTFVQIVRLHKYAYNKTQNPSPAHHSQYTNGSGDSATSNYTPPNLAKTLPDINTDGTIPELTVRDSPDRAFRAVYQDFSGCRILNPDTVLQLATRLSACKANYLFVNFEVRTTDRYQLPYTNRDLFHMMQVCQELFVTFVPSIDTQTNNLDNAHARIIIDQFLDDFPLCKVVHFGPNLASLLIADRKFLTAIQRRVPRIFLSTHVDERNGPLLSTLPPFVTLCVEGTWPFEIEKYISPRISIVIKFSTGDDGYLCAAPESMAKKALLAAKLSERHTVLGSMSCDLSTGCESMPPSLSYMSLLASVGVAFNSSTDVKKYAFLLPNIAAHHMLLDGDMSCLFEQIMTLGKVEHQLTKYAYGYWKPSISPNDSLNESFLSNSFSKKMPISVFVEMILNPEKYEYGTIDTAALEEIRHHMRYDYELSLLLSEIKLVTDLMVLVSRLGQSICANANNPVDRKRSLEEGVPSAIFGHRANRAGVVNMAPASRTDLANVLLVIRSQFHHVWLCRCIPSTLPNALKMFDNLYKALLPPDLQEMGKQYL
ncbi:unnamed protein product [Caenorhabditis angaria]|uniref:Beta-hexosaminidase bacterial type N-terminal domain-containing protein n=1 Tax=Caenorhabditis angaria TaxID=860376 RepID=A0A9P1NA69_9PELO|nr:unnamed protein product [Caenorhabditis angaria]